MGYLSDTAVFNHLVDCTFLAAFFEKGLRANNTTVNAAMECGCAVITNLDEHSPAGLTHLKNVIDINKCEKLPDTADVERIGRAARDIAHAEYGWDQLVTQSDRRQRSAVDGRAGVRENRSGDRKRDLQGQPIDGR
jgi:hypothetical protein